MGIFFKKKLGSDEYEDLIKKIIKVQGDIDLLTAKLSALETNQNSLRGLVNRKFGNYDEEEDLSSSDGLDELRRIKHG